MRNDTNTFRAHSQDCTVEKPHKQVPCLQIRKLVFRLGRPATGFLLAGLLTLFLVGCTQEDSRSKGEGTFMSISSVSMAGTGTKSTTTIAANGASLGTFRLAANGYSAQSNAQYTYSTSTLGWSATSPITLNPAAASICAYYPYGAAGITGSTDPTAIMLTSQKYDAAQDLCYATNVTTLSSFSSTAAFAMQRAYAQLTFTITCGSSFIGTGNITNIAIANAGTLSSASFKITDGTFNSTTPGVVSFNPGIASIVPGTSATTSILMVPVTTSMTGNLNLSFIVDGKIMTASLPMSTFGVTTLVAGNNYNIPVSISASYMTVGSVSTVDWSSVAITATKVQPLQVESNCYIMAPNSSITIPVSRANTGNAANFSSTTMPWTTGLLWTDVANPLTASGTIASITGIGTSFINGCITITAGSATGNAVVYVMNKNSQICWSWHVWVTGYDPRTSNIGYNSLIWMDRDLGATNNTPNNIGCMGLYYQWGRKDPFPGASAVATNAQRPIYNASGSVAFTALTAVASGLSASIANPGVFYFNASSPYDWYSNSTTQNNALWGSTKTVYDPCPTGWKVPANGAWPSSLTTDTWLTNGATFAGGWYQASGFRDNSAGAFSNVSYSGHYWSSAVSSTDAYGLGFSSGSVVPSGSTNRAYGVSVRCVKE